MYTSIHKWGNLMVITNCYFTAPESAACARAHSQIFITGRNRTVARHRIYVKACDVVDGASATDFWVDQGISLHTF